MIHIMIIWRCGAVAQTCTATIVGSVRKNEILFINICFFVLVVRQKRDDKFRKSTKESVLKLDSLCFAIW